MTLPYSYSRLKCKLALDKHLPRLLESTIQESGGIKENLIYGKLTTAPGAEVRDCTVFGELRAGPGSRVIGCRVAPGAVLDVGANCTVVSVQVDKDTSVEDGSVLCRAALRSSVIIGKNARVLDMHVAYHFHARVRFGDNLQLLVGYLQSTGAVDIGDDATFLCAGLSLFCEEPVKAGRGFVAAEYARLAVVETQLTHGRPSDPVASARETLAAQVDCICLRSSGSSRIGDDVRLEGLLDLTAGKGFFLGDHSRLQTARAHKRNHAITLGRLWMEPYSALVVYGSSPEAYSENTELQLKRGGTLCWTNASKPCGMLRVIAPSGECTVI